MSPHAKDSDCTVVDGVCIECGVGHGEPCTGIIFKLGDLCMGRGFHRPGCLESDDTDVDAAPQTPLQIALTTASDCAKAFASARTERNAPYESPTLNSDLAYRDTRSAVRIARLIETHKS